MFEFIWFLFNFRLHLDSQHACESFLSSLTLHILGRRAKALAVIKNWPLPFHTGRSLTYIHVSSCLKEFPSTTAWILTEDPSKTLSRAACPLTDPEPTAQVTWPVFCLTDETHFPLMVSGCRIWLKHGTIRGGGPVVVIYVGLCLSRPRRRPDWVWSSLLLSSSRIITSSVTSLPFFLWDCWLSVVFLGLCVLPFL